MTWPVPFYVLTGIFSTTAREREKEQQHHRRRHQLLQLPASVACDSWGLIDVCVCTCALCLGVLGQRLELVLLATSLGGRCICLSSSDSLLDRLAASYANKNQQNKSGKASYLNSNRWREGVCEVNSYFEVCCCFVQYGTTSKLSCRQKLQVCHGQ